MNADSIDQDTHSLFFETSPYGNLDAIVEHDGRSVHFYLNGKEFGMRACWVRNLIPGPYVINTEDVERGIPPMLPRTHCKYSTGKPLYEPDSLNVVWFEEGNGAALYSGDEVLAIIPPWSGVDGFHGYASECAAESPFCWPMPNKPQLFERVQRAQSFWEQCNSQPSHPFAELQRKLLNELEKKFGAADEYFSIDGGKFPPRGLARFKKDEIVTLSTIGMSLCPQPNVELMVELPAASRRIELAIQFQDESLIEPLQSRLGSLGAYPWRHHRWLGSGHTLALLGEESSSHEHALLVHEEDLVEKRDLSPIKLGSFRGDPINLLWMAPLTAAEKSEIEVGQTKVADWILKCSVWR